jgi:hypothetical protein
MTFAAMFKRLESRRPPSLTAILEVFDSVEYITEFVNLVRKFLPNREEDIMNQVSGTDRCLEFVRLFSDQYHVELAEYDFSDEPYQQLMWGIPIALEGLNYSDYDDFATNYSSEWLCMAALVSYPFWLGDKQDGSSERIPLLESASGLVGATVERIPAAGFKPEALHKKLDGTKYEGLACFADWLHADTGCWKLDVNYEDNPEGPNWDEETVAELVRQEPIKLDIQRKVTELELWLNEDIRAHFAELVNAVVGRPVLKEQLTLLEVKDE